MPKNPHDPSRREIEQQEKSRQRFEADVLLRQSNVLPMDAARNEGRFYGQLIRGDRPLNGTQRVGFFLIGAMFCGFGIFILVGIFPRFFSLVGLRGVLSDKSVSMLYLPFTALVLLLGLKVVITALRPYRRNHNQE